MSQIFPKLFLLFFLSISLSGSHYVVEDYEDICETFTNVFIVSVDSIKKTKTVRSLKNGTKVPTSYKIAIKGKVVEELRGNLREKFISLDFRESVPVDYGPDEIKVTDLLVRRNATGKERLTKVGQSYIVSLQGMIQNGVHFITRMDELSEKEHIAKSLQTSCPMKGKVMQFELQDGKWKQVPHGATCKGHCMSHIIEPTH